MPVSKALVGMELALKKYEFFQMFKTVSNCSKMFQTVQTHVKCL